MKKNGLIFEVGDLIQEDQGASTSFDINIKNELELGKEAKGKSQITGEVRFMRLEDGINAEIGNIETDVEFRCVKCTEKFIKKIKIPYAERVFYFNKQGGDIDVFDTFYVDTKNMTIDMSDFIRQEIILHFPLIPVCSKSCKGLCPYCGKNLNEGPCGCKKKKKNPEVQKPLSALKKLYKSANKNS